MQTINIFHIADDPAIVRPTIIKPDASSSQIKKVMGDNLLNISFEENHYIAFQINDWCDVFGEKYFLSELPIVTKTSRYLYKYSLKMQAQGYDLSKAQYLFLGATNTLRESEFSLMGTASDFIDLIISNANRVGSGWLKGQVIPSAFKNLTFNKENCYNALSRLAEEFDTEFAIEGKIIHLVKRTKDTGYTFKHGRFKGLYDITRTNLSNSSLVTRLYAYGSDKNLPSSYITTGKRLRFPGGFNPCLISDLTATIVDNGNGTKTYTFNWTAPLSPGVTDVSIEWKLIGTSNPLQFQLGVPTSPRSVTVPLGSYEFQFRTYGSTCWTFTPGWGIPTPLIPINADITVPILVYTPLPFIERNVNLYGVIEHTEIFDDIYPHRTGTVTAVNAADEHEFSDSAIDFDVNSYLLPGLTAKATFNTGQLTGYTFEIRSFDNGTKKFIVNKNADERILDIPSASLRPAIGDKYVLTDIEMPTIYVTAAENALLAAANTLLDELSKPQLSYTMTLDPLYIKKTNRILNISDLVWIEDAELDLQRKIRITSVTRNIVNEFSLTVELSDIVSPGTISRLISSLDANGRDVSDINRQLLNNSILNNNVVGTLVFQNIPTTTTMVGFSNVVIETATGKLYKKI